MSRILDLGNKYENLPQVMEEYERALDGVADIISVRGKNLEKANREQPSWLHYYDQKRIELRTLDKYFEGRLKKIRGKLFRSYTEKSNQELSDRAKDKYIDNEEAYLSMFEVSLEITEMYEKYCSVVNTFQQRGYSLNNITKVRVASLEDAEIY